MPNYDASIYSQIQQPQAINPLAQLAQASQIQGAQQQNKLAQLQMAEYERQRTQDDQQRQAVISAGTDPAAIGNSYLKLGNVKGYTDYQKALADHAKTVADAEQQRVATEAKKWDLRGQAFGFVKDNPTPDNLAATITSLQGANLIDPGQVQKLQSMVQADPSPAGIQKVATMLYQGALSAKDQLPTFQTRNTGGTTDTLSISPVTGKVAVANSVANTQSPDSIASNATSRSNNAATIANSRANNTATIQAGFKTAGLDNQGNYVDGQSALGGLVDAIGQGKITESTALGRVAPAAKAQIMAQVAQKYPEYDPTTIAAKTKAARDFTSGAQGNAMRSFAVASNHLDQLNSLVDALDNGNLQLVNKYGNMIAAQTGSTAPTNFDAAKDVVGKEVVKAIVAGGGGVSERQELSNLMSNAKTPAQLKGVIGQYRNLMGAQHQALLQQRRAAGLPDSTLPDYKVDAGEPTSASPHPADISSLLDKYGGKR